MNKPSFRTNFTKSIFKYFVPFVDNFIKWNKNIFCLTAPLQQVSFMTLCKFDNIPNTWRFHLKSERFSLFCKKLNYFDFRELLTDWPDLYFREQFLWIFHTNEIFSISLMPYFTKINGFRSFNTDIKKNVFPFPTTSCYFSFAEGWRFLTVHKRKMKLITIKRVLRKVN